ncbi:MAG TPA: RNA polymerase sigma-70 factor [Agriterribacter sp.]|nr:RNA polymerase sigma-70 factor [Agriterribacter sp.]HRQ49048.1 RNA polymerase sigma-70 factor [Agriterribacter sp.]
MASSADISDEILVARLQKGDQLAFEAIYTRYWQTLYAIAYNRLKAQAEAEDIVHDVFTLIWQRRYEVKPGSLSAYLAAAVKYAVLSHIRKRDSARKYILHESATIRMEVTSDHQLHHKRILQMVQSEIERLPERCRLIFKYSREKGMSTKEIARTLNLSDKTVENQISKALHHLKSSFRNVFSSFFQIFL